MSELDKIKYYHELVCKYIGFNIVLESKKTSRTINQGTYNIQKNLVTSLNIINSDSYNLALPSLNDAFVESIDNTHINSLTSIDVLTQLVKFKEEFNQFTKLYIEIKSKIEDDVSGVATIEEMSKWVEITNNFDKWFELFEYSTSDTKINTIKPTKQSDVIYLGEHIEPWLNSLNKLAIDTNNDGNSYISHFAKQDKKVDLNFSAFYFAFVQDGNIYLITDRPKFSSISKKFFTRRPERVREDAYDKIPLPHNIFLSQNYLYKVIQKQLILLHIQKKRI